MWIVSTDGKYVYGYAIAADTGDQCSRKRLLWICICIRMRRPAARCQAGSHLRSVTLSLFHKSPSKRDG